VADTYLVKIVAYVAVATHDTEGAVQRELRVVVQKAIEDAMDENGVLEGLLSPLRIRTHIEDRN